MTETSLAALWENAICEYEKSIGQPLFNSDLQCAPVNFQDTNGRSLQAFLEALHVNQDQFTAHRNEKRRVVSAFRKCILPLHFILDIADRGLQATPAAPLSALFFAVKHILNTCERVSNAYDAVEELFQRVAAVTCSLDGYKDSSLIGTHQTVVVEVLSCLLKIVGVAQSRLVKPSRLRQFGRSLFQNDESINEALAELERRVHDELGYVVRLNFGMTQRMSETTLSIHKQVLEIRQEILRSRANGEFLDARTDLVEKLKNESWEELRNHHRKSADAIAATTGMWIQNDSMFATWENGNGSLLWIFGRPGVGKTVLAAATVETLKNKYSRHADNGSVRPTGYMYFKEGQPKLQNLSDMLLAVALQIAKQDQRFYDHLVETVRTYPDILGKAASAESLWDRLFLSYDPLLEDHEEAGGLIYIIIDGLDEANDEAKHSLLTCLRRLLASQPNHERISIQVAVFARPEIRNLLDNTDAAFQGKEKIIDITEDQTKQDIRVYVRHHTKAIAAVRMIRKMEPEQSQAFEAFIENSIVTRSQGMFLWAKLVIDQIRDSPSAEAVEEALNDAPSGLMDMIHLVFLRLNHESDFRTQYLMHLLAWVLCCRRPLTIAELHVCLHETLGQHFITISDDLTKRYSSLFDVIRQSNGDDASKTIKSTSSSNREESEDDLDSVESDDGELATGYTPSRPSFKQFSFKRISVHANNGIFDEWHRSTVTFAHARIRDYLVQEGNPLTKKWNDCRVVPGQIDHFKMQMVQALLDLAMKPTAQKYGVHLLRQYAADNCVSHLVEIDLGAMPEDLCGQVGAKLASLCFDGKMFYDIQNGLWQTTIDSWLLDRKKPDIVRALIAKGIHCLSTENPEIRPWAMQAVDSARVLLQPLIKECARIWLAKRSWDDLDWFNKCDGETWVLLAYEFLTPKGDNIGPVSILKGTRRVGRITLDLIEQIARSQNLEEDEYWCTGVAWTMMDGGDPRHTRRAIEYFQKAITLAEARTRELYGVEKPTAWVAYEGLSRCYGDNLGQPLPALEAIQKAIEALPPILLNFGVDFYFRARAAYWQLQTGGNHEDATRVGREAYERCQMYTFGTNSPSDYIIMDSCKLYIEILSRTQDYGSISAVLRHLATCETLLPGCSLLHCLLRHKFTEREFKRLTGIIAMVLYKRPDPDLQNLLQDNFKRVAYIDLSGRPKWNDLRLAVRSANFLLRHFKDVAGATKIFTSILSVIDSNDESYRQRLKPIRNQAAAFVSFRRFTEAVEARLSKQSRYSQPAEKLRSLALEDKRRYRASYSALLYGVWLRDHRSKSPKVWRPIFEPSIAEAIYKLHDDDPWNDDDAYNQLGEALMMGNDLENAATAFGITMMLTDELATQPEVPDEGTDSDHKLGESTGGAVYKYASSRKIRHCDGICDPTKDDFAELWCCCLCEKTWLCGDCLVLLRKQDPEADSYVICSSDHSHLRVYPVSDRARDIVSGLRRNNFDKHRQWLREVQAAWSTE
ncbi:uncharacterized protein PV07_06331 [Cladophialophora immunda]|uniref:Fungal STAND N-terminal Goodbye domain-containing protein n=1 Tax=Cladophialophora immunda TaxID=569365 RepID=A0A0D2AZ84_9EURO|nr:uncharacterized protein PV07_06331 [Cladophialophora immunda]KIW30597.1 hypothetical protein PV07_06331 [Cladophialophora immunda]OQU99574.1 NACHT domain-containing protein [Cladophialophora immunda]